MTSFNNGNKRKIEGEEGENKDATKMENVKCFKSYRNDNFLASRQARLIRIMCELEEPQARMAAENVDNIVMFFGSARAKPRPQYEEALKEAEAKVAAKPGDPAAEAGLVRLKKQEFLVGMFDVVVETTRLFTEWSMRRQAEGKSSYIVGTGGGPGMMQAANEGAYRAGGRSAGLGISLPFEDGLNPFVTPALGFEFHYFFTRKFWMAYKCMGLVVAPGGLGTCDELFEFLTLVQTGKIKRSIPVVLIGKKFWHDCITWDAFVDYGMISAQDASQLNFADTAQEALQFLVEGVQTLEKAEAQEGAKSPCKKKTIGLSAMEKTP
jgi:uncharacterized protein (TIGR00730 family)